MSRFPQDMLLWPDGQPRVLNSDNRLKGEINGVSYRVDLKGDFAIISLIDTRTQLVYRLVRPRFDVLGLILACAEVAEGRPGQRVAEYVSLRRGDDDACRLDGLD